ncbi:hypothetical protein NQ315_010774 [Exocentrus adspersus]|uniref:Uncharacterized protein n=1 Tax=Exocentrus adspersus TaxID=1586481 RepID=A0AAV8VW14_9CUCU|nr:hypothetical protein NQ315_010774 [Exocentrus adspersus]
MHSENKISTVITNRSEILFTRKSVASSQVEISLARSLADAVCMHFLFLAAFFWLNTMCFNIWWTFRRSAGLDIVVNYAVFAALYERIST